MNVLVYPADQFACGHFRLIWPAEVLQRQGYEVTCVLPANRHVKIIVDDDDRVTNVEVPENIDVMVLQRVTHRYLAEAVPLVREQGVAVVIDVDDDLGAIHPGNPAWQMLRPNVGNEHTRMHSWNHLAFACRHASMVTVTTPALLDRYAAHGRGRVIPNYVPDHYLRHEHYSSERIVWPAALHSHPDDPSAVGNAISRLVTEGAQFGTLSTDVDGVRRAFGLPAPPLARDEPIAFTDWPGAVAGIGIGIAPLADTRFNAAKSWLKPLELSALGVPWVASPRVEYERLHRLGCGLLAAKPREWYGILRRLLRDSDYRTELSESGRSVAKTLRLDDHAWRWWEAWDDALRLERAGI